MTEKRHAFKIRDLTDPTAKPITVGTYSRDVKSKHRRPVRIKMTTTLRPIVSAKLLRSRSAMASVVAHRLRPRLSNASLRSLLSGVKDAIEMESLDAKVLWIPFVDQTEPEPARRAGSRARTVPPASVAPATKRSRPTRRLASSRR